jgi:hypothetical protein
VQKKCFSELHHISIRCYIIQSSVVVASASTREWNTQKSLLEENSSFNNVLSQKKIVYKLYTRSRLKVYFGKILFCLLFVKKKRFKHSRRAKKCYFIIMKGKTFPLQQTERYENKTESREKRDIKLERYQTPSCIHRHRYRAHQPKATNRASSESDFFFSLLRRRIVKQIFNKINFMLLSFFNSEIIWREGRRIKTFYKGHKSFIILLYSVFSCLCYSNCIRILHFWLVFCYNEIFFKQNVRSFSNAKGLPFIPCFSSQTPPNNCNLIRASRVSH